jgi:hypothetical protein
MGAGCCQVPLTSQDVGSQATGLHLGQGLVDPASQLNDPIALLEATIKVQVEAVDPGSPGQGLHFQDGVA